MPKYYFSENVNYVEILRYPLGEEARMREWMDGRAYYERIYKEEDCNEDGDANYSDGSDDDDTGGEHLKLRSICGGVFALFRLQSSGLKSKNIRRAN